MYHGLHHEQCPVHCLIIPYRTEISILGHGTLQLPTYTNYTEKYTDILICAYIPLFQKDCLSKFNQKIR